MADQDQKAPKVRKVTDAREIPAHLEMKADAEPKTREFKFVEKNSISVTHHLFKAKVAKFLKNNSYKKDNPDLIPMAHEHIFHTVDSRGKKMTHCGFVGGHTHEIKVVENPDGTMTVECGPPVKQVVTKDRTGRRKTKFVPVEFYDAFARDGEGEMIVDSHIHDMEYRGSEVWTQAEMKARGGAVAVSLDDGLAKQREVLKKANVQITE